MIDEILARYRRIDWDFRAIASAADPLAHLFPQWVDYYRLKAAVAAALQPATILEIGVRYGYSYAAFKQGWPGARYLGIDLDSATFGGELGAIQWARDLARGTGDDFLIANTQEMDRLPGGPYDLIHIDGQQDGQGTYRDLGLAVSQGSYLLVDGFLWTRDNCLSVSEFMQRYREVLSWALMIPGYAGELLIKVDPAHLARETRRLEGRDAAPATGGGSEEIREHYTASYYQEDCGGWESFAQHRAKRLTDPRLRGLLDLALFSRPRRLLDLGCGRGEIAYHAARQGVRVTAVDYSADAIALAKTCFEEEPHLLKHVEWVCTSAADLALEGEYDVVIAGDLVEHLAPAELERMYANVGRHLAPGGVFVVHTFPNAWFYRYDYARKLRVAASVGAYLPLDPRSRYEKLMHINEQSPRVLKRQLGASFENVLLWFLQPPDQVGTLKKPMRCRELAACRDLYAVGSHRPVDRQELLAVLSMEALDAAEAAKVHWEVKSCPDRAEAGAEFTVETTLSNGSARILNSWRPHPVNLCYHWRRAASGETFLYDGIRTRLTPLAVPGSRGDYTVVVQAPREEGDFLLEVAVVQEGVRWFESLREGELPRYPVRIEPPGGVLS